MNYNLHWLITTAYNKKLISRERFVSLWAFVQSLNKERNKDFE